MKILNAMIIGVIDYQDAVHSHILHNYVENYSDYLNHSDYFPHITYKKWRWTYDDGIKIGVGSENLTEEDVDFICNHLRRIYGIRFTDEGRIDRGFYEKLININIQEE